MTDKITLYRLQGKKLDFEDFLRDKHAKEYRGTDDNMIDDYENWLTKIFYEEYIDYANKFITAKLEKVEITMPDLIDVIKDPDKGFTGYLKQVGLHDINDLAQAILKLLGGEK